MTEELTPKKKRVRKPKVVKPQVEYVEELFDTSEADTLGDPVEALVIEPLPGEQTAVTYKDNAGVVHTVSVDASPEQKSSWISNVFRRILG